MLLFKYLRGICLINIISLIIIVVLVNYRHWQNKFFFEPLVDSTRSYYIESALQNERINALLQSYHNFYDDSQRGCTSNVPLTDEQKDAFDKISTKLITLRTELIEYPKEYFHGRGIVLTASRKQLRYARANLRILETTGTRLPVQIWYSTTQASHEEMLHLLLTAPNLNASVCCFSTSECRNSRNVWNLNSSFVYQPSRNRYRSGFFPYKPAAIVSATFAEVLFLDCDAYVTRDPEPLFLSDPMYLRFGALFYPDAMRSRQHPAVWSLFNTSCAKDEREFDSAMILVDKRRVWNGLYMTKLMNDDYRTFYEHVSDGDKDTFRLAFRYLQVKYYLVMTPCTTGSYHKSYFCGHSLCKTDSLSQHIYVSHVHLFKYDKIRFSPYSLEYTRIGLGDPYNNTFLFQHCKLTDAPTTCFHILKEPNEEQSQNGCYNGYTSSDEIENHRYTLNEPLVNEKLPNNRVLMSRTNNLMPDFVDNLIKYFY